MSTPITLATFNCYWLYDNEEPLKRWGERLPDGGLAEKVEQIASSIIAIGDEEGSPDIVALQEVENEFVIERLLVKLVELGHHYAHSWVSQTLDPFTGQNVALLSKYPATIEPIRRLDQTTQEYFDHHGRSRIGSLGKFLRVDVQVKQQVISVYIAHLKSRRGGTQNSRYLREAQAQILRRYSRPRVEQGSNRSPSFVAMVGDFNDNPGSTPLQIMQGERDPSYELRSATRDLSEEEQYTHTFGSEKAQLDHILLNLFADQRTLAAGFTRIDDEISDHDAVWVRLDLDMEPDDD